VIKAARAHSLSNPDREGNDLLHIRVTIRNGLLSEYEVSFSVERVREPLYSPLSGEHM
jgi:hypothetical protein